MDDQDARVPQEPGNASPYFNPEQAAPPPPAYQGVGGWLLLLCLGLTVFSPLLTVAALATSFTASAAAFDRFPGLLVVVVVDTLLSVCLMAFSVYAGTGLWTIRPGAVAMAKRYLLFFLAYSAVAAVLPFLAGLPAKANNAMLASVFKDTGRAIIYFAVWYSYLGKSSRVQATYRD